LVDNFGIHSFALHYRLSFKITLFSYMESNFYTYKREAHPNKHLLWYPQNFDNGTQYGIIVRRPKIAYKYFEMKATALPNIRKAILCPVARRYIS